MNEVLGQNQDPVLYTALQGEAVTNVSAIVNLSDSDIDHIQFTSVSMGRPSRRHWDKPFEHSYSVSLNSSTSRSEKAGGFTKKGRTLHHTRRITCVCHTGHWYQAVFYNTRARRNGWKWDFGTFGSQWQRQRLLPPLLMGRILSCLWTLWRRRSCYWCLCSQRMCYIANQGWLWR